MSGYQQFGFGRNDDGVGNKSKRFKGEGGRRYRVSFAWWKGLDKGDMKLDSDTPEFLGAPRNYIPNVGYIVNRGPEYTKLAGGEAPRMAIGTILIVWPMDQKGNLDKTALGNGDFEVVPWIFGQDKYRLLDPIHKDFHFGEHDLTISCTDTQYQKMAFTPCKDSLLAKIKEKGGSMWASILEKVQAVAATIQGDIGREMTLDQIREKMAGGGTMGGGGGPSTSVATEDIDNLVDNLLD